MLSVGAYSCCPDIFHSWTVTRHRLYVLWMNTLVNSQSSNSFMGKIPNWRRRWMVFAMSCSWVYRFCAMSAISWHCSIWWKSSSGAWVRRKGDLNNSSFSHTVLPLVYRIIIPTAWEWAACSLWDSIQGGSGGWRPWSCHWCSCWASWTERMKYSRTKWSNFCDSYRRSMVLIVEWRGGNSRLGVL